MGQFLSIAESYLSIVARCVLVGLFFVQSFLQFPLCLQIELLVPALWLTGLLPKFIRAADNIYPSRPCHHRSPYSSSGMAKSHDPGLGMSGGLSDRGRAGQTIVMARKTNSNF